MLPPDEDIDFENVAQPREIYNINDVRGSERPLITDGGTVEDAPGYDADPDVIEARGQVINVDSGETWENKIIDLGDGNDIDVIANGTDWTIRNIEIRGTFHHTTHDYLFGLSDTEGGESTIENVYAGEGDPGASSSQRGGVIWVPPKHSGELNVKNVNFNVEGALGIYGHSPGTGGGARGTVHIEGCYAKDCHHTAYRIADNESSITDSVVYKTGDRPASRACWIWEGHGGGAFLKDLDIITNGEGGGIVTNGDPDVRISNVRSDADDELPDPEHRIPEGCPESGDDVWTSSGGDGGDTGSDPDMSYDTITANGQVIRLGNQTWENKLIDVSNGNGITVVPEGNTTIRNVGVTGQYRGDGFIFSITSDSEVEFENIYVGDGAIKSGSDHPHGPGAFFFHRQGSADVTFTNINVQGYPNNAFYCSNTAYAGSVKWFSCFGKNNGVSTFRAASGNDKIVGCVALNDDETYGSNWGGYTEDSGRPVWVWGGNNAGEVEIVDSHFEAGDYGSAILTHNGGRAVMRGGAVSGTVSGAVSRENVGSDPDTSIPDGVPTSAMEAASGGTEAPVWESDPHYVHEPSADDWPTRFTVNAVDSEAEFELLADAEIFQGYWWSNDPGSEYIENVRFEEAEEGHVRVTGKVVDDSVCLVTTGDIVAASVHSDDYALWRNGEEHTADEYPSVDDYMAQYGEGGYGDGSYGGDSREELLMRIEELEEEKTQLADELAEYQDAMEQFEQMAEEGQKNVPFLSSMWEYILDKVPGRSS